MMILYVMFLVSSGFALFSLLTGVLVDHVNLASQSARAQSEAKTQYLPHVYKVMKLIDTDGTGSITFPELQEAMKNPGFGYSQSPLFYISIPWLMTLCLVGSA